MTRQQIPIDEYSVHIRTYVSGRKHAVLMVHGLGASSRYWTPLAHQLKRSCDVYVPDLPGFGKSSSTDEALDVSEQADVLYKIIEVMDRKRITLIGNSYGCQIIIDLLSRYKPSKKIISHAILLGPTINEYERNGFKQVGRLIQDGKFEPPWSFLFLLRDYMDAGNRQIMQTLKHALRDKPEDKVQGIKIPVMVVRGEHDVITPPPWAQKIYEGLPNGYYCEIKGGGHAVHIKPTADTARIISSFIGINYKKPIGVKPYAFIGLAAVLYAVIAKLVSKKSQ